MRVFAQDGYLAVDFANRRLTVIARDRGTPVPDVAGFGMEEISWQDHDSLAAEHAAFVAVGAGRRAGAGGCRGGTASAGGGAGGDRQHGGRRGRGWKYRG